MPKADWLNILSALREKLQTQDKMKSEDVYNGIHNLYYVVQDTDDLSQFPENGILIVTPSQAFLLDNQDDPPIEDPPQGEQEG